MDDPPRPQHDASPPADRGAALRSEIVVTLNGLTKHYGREAAVEDVSFDVRRGELFALLGPNGAGKTTTFGMMMGLVRPTRGRVTMLGHAAADAVRLHRRVGALLEYPAFLDGLSARTNLEYLARPHGGAARRRIDEVLALVGLERRARDRVRTYSQGMKQRLGLAAALLHDPELLILDEPTNGLDPEGSDEVWALLRRLVAVEGKTLIVSSHLLHEIEAACDRVALLRRGRLVACEPMHDLLMRAAGGARRLRLGFADRETAERARRQMTELATVAGAPGDVEVGRVVAPGGYELEVGVGADTPRGAAALLEALAGAGQTPIAAVPVRPTLKDLFLQLTGTGADRPG